jgi:ATP-dependent Clp protease ATP-binding subunit ClpA
MRISPEVEVAFSLATARLARRHEYVTVEHLLYALLFDDDTAETVKHAGGDVENLKKALETYLDERARGAARGRETAASACRSASSGSWAARRCTCSRRQEELKGVNVLVAMFAERDSPRPSRSSASRASAASTW